MSISHDGYIEDPTGGIAGMAQVAGRVQVPLATNMCVTRFEHFPPAVEQGAVQNSFMPS